jgi:hypothetical protein
VQLRQDLAVVQETQKRLLQNIADIERELNEILRLLSRLLGEEH